MWQSDSRFYYTTWRNPETPAKHAAAGRQGLLTALVGFLDLTLDLSFSDSPESSFFSGSFTTLRISLSGQRKKKEYYKMIQCLAFFVIICFIYCLLDCIIPRYLLNCYPPYTYFRQCMASPELLQCLQKPVLSKNPSTQPQASTGYHSPQFFSTLYAISINFNWIMSRFIS